MCRTDARDTLAQAQHQGADPRVSAEECECEKPGKKIKARKPSTLLGIRQESCYDAEQWQEGTHLEDKLNTGLVG